MDCRDCARYDAGEGGGCGDRKINPATWEDAVNVGQLYGLRAVCLFNDHRERLIASRVGSPTSVLSRSGPRSHPAKDPLDRDRS